MMFCQRRKVNAIHMLYITYKWRYVECIENIIMASKRGFKCFSHKYCDECFAVICPVFVINEKEEDFSGGKVYIMYRWGEWEHPMQFMKTQLYIILCSFVACLGIFRMLFRPRPSMFSFIGCTLETVFISLPGTTRKTETTPSQPQAIQKTGNRNTSGPEDDNKKQIDALKSQFLLQVNHELRTPLTAVYCYLDLLRTRQTQLTPNEQEMFIEKALKACEDLVKATNQILQSLEDEI
jgi:hypothetical protein